MTLDDARRLVADTKPAASLVASGRSDGDQAGRKGDHALAATLYASALAEHRAKVLGPIEQEFANQGTPDPASEVHRVLATHLADAHGIAGGLLRRLGCEDDAAAEYDKGGELERLFQLPETYNRSNALMCGIRGKRLSQQEIAAAARSILPEVRRKLQRPEYQGRAWALADLGLLLLLSGEEVEVAVEDAYAELLGLSDFPARDLRRVIADVRECGEHLREVAPVVAGRLAAAGSFLDSRLA